MDRKDIRHIGEVLRKKKTWRNGLTVGGQTAEIVGSGLVLAAPLAGVAAPAVAGTGATLVGGGKVVEQIGKSHLLKAKPRKNR